jgi:hypothetical protein
MSSVTTAPEFGSAAAGLADVVVCGAPLMSSCDNDPAFAPAEIQLR